MEWMKRAWRGEERLWKVYWIYGFVGGVVYSILSFVLGMLSLGILLIPLMLFFLVYFVWVTVAQWRCAFNANSRVWGILVRILIVISIVPVVGGLGFSIYSGLTGTMGAHEATMGSEMKVDTGALGKPGAVPLDDEDAPAAVPPAPLGQTVAPADDEDGVIPAVPAAPAGMVAPAAPDASAPVAPAPTASAPEAVAPVGGEDVFKQECIQKMKDYAMQNGADPEAYVAQNQAYVEQCVAHKSKK